MSTGASLHRTPRPRRLSPAPLRRRRRARRPCSLVRHGESAPAVPGAAVPAARRPRRSAARSGRRAAGRAARRAFAPRADRRDLRDVAAAHASDRGTARPAPRPRGRRGAGPAARSSSASGKAASSASAPRPAIPSSAQIWEEERWDVIPGGEAQDAFDERVWRGFQRIVAAHPDRRVDGRRARWRHRPAAAPRHRLAPVRVLGCRQRVDQ